MNKEFYSIPLALEQIMQKKEHPKCSLQQSIAQSLHLIITTALGEWPADDNFGCSIWDHDFDNITSSHKLKEWIIESLQNSIQQYEKRLRNVQIDLVIRQEEKAGNPSGYKVKKRIIINITAFLHSTNENFTYQDSFFTAPLSYQLI